MTVNHIITEMQEVFHHTSQALATSSGFCQRTSLISARSWVQGLVFGWLSNPQASLSELASALGAAGAPVSPQAVQQRFSSAGARLLGGVLESLTRYALHQATRQALSRREHSWLDAFPALWIRDSTLITLPLELQHQWPGTGGCTGPSAALKVSVQWEWHSGLVAPLHLTPAKEHDQKAARQQDRLALQQGHYVMPGEMHLFDLGYFDLEWLGHLHAQGAYFCCRYKAATSVQRLESSGVSQGSVLKWLEALPATQQQVEWEVKLGGLTQLPVRLLAVRVPSEVAAQRRIKAVAHNQRKRQKVSEERLALYGWNLYVTNAPACLLSLEQTRVLYRLRWQIERLFRLWKETLGVDKWRSHNPQRILCEIYAKLIGALLTQKITAFCLWHDPARSLVKCAQAIAGHALSLLTHLRDNTALARTLRALQRACGHAAKLNSRRQKPATFQRIQLAQHP